MCNSGLTNCGGSCVALGSDNRNCGACGATCSSGQSCSGGRCLCPNGLTNCNGYCVALDSDRSNCGRCGNSCPSDSIGCSSGNCQFRPTCPAGQTNCGSESSLNCVILDSNQQNCGACGRSCPNGQSCTGGKCVCPSGQTDCNGYCVSIDSDKNHCGRCGNSCPSDSIGCSSGNCQFRPTCPAGQTNCGSETSLNCVVLDSNQQNCGSCGRSCPNGQTCSGGRCVCPSGLTDCNGFCVAIDSDRNYCGRCGNSCPADSTGCSSGACQFRPTCSPGQTNCGSQTSLNCVALDSDLRHCGTCGAACPSGQICASGVCSCSSELTKCGDACVSTSSDVKHCGRCDNACDSRATGCSGGVCQIPTVNPPAATALPPASSVTTTTTKSTPSTTSTTSNSLPTSTVLFASAPTAIATPSGATTFPLEAGSRIFLTSGTKGLSCNPGCVLADGSSGEYAVAAIPGSAAIRLQRGSSCLQAQRSASSSFAVIDGSCPTSGAGRRQRRQGEPQLFPNWVLYNSSGSTKLMNANMDAASGCMQVPSAGSVGLGSCSSAQAGQWTFSAGPATAPPPASSSTNIGAIVGGVVGGVAAIAAAGGIGYYVHAKRGKAAEAENGNSDSVSTLADEEADHGLKKSPVAPANALAAAQPEPAAAELIVPAMPAPGAATQKAADALFEPPIAYSKSKSSATILASQRSTPTAVLAASSGSGGDGFAVNISPSASKLLIHAEDVAIDRSQRLGEGGFGVVYVGTLRGSNKVAVKTIKGDLDEKTMTAFVKEVANWEGLVQRNVLPLMAFCISPPMMVMDLIEEGNLRKFLGQRAWDQALGRRFLHDVACGMAYLHASGILHGDLKSLNVLVDGMRAVITDFGLSRVRVEVSKSTNRTGNGMQGTPGFVAPEMLAGETLKPPADVYAYAMLCYEVVSKGKYPFDDLNNVAAVCPPALADRSQCSSANRSQIVYKVAIEKIRPTRPAGVPDAMWALMERCWDQDPACRPDFVEIQNELTKIL
ncbi:hypothetical protein DFJ74DRAFT_324043 [Hyaloraphidium curvatum]|nr:hypothetical protein DFJ74DRAFT_324043 [Hyaloraphidium curvatum]